MIDRKLNTSIERYNRLIPAAQHEIVALAQSEIDRVAQILSQADDEEGQTYLDELFRLVEYAGETPTSAHIETIETPVVSYNEHELIRWIVQNMPVLATQLMTVAEDELTRFVASNSHVDETGRRDITPALFHLPVALHTQRTYRVRSSQAENQ